MTAHRAWVSLRPEGPDAAADADARAAASREATDSAAPWRAHAGAHLSVREVKARLHMLGVPHAGVLERSELDALLRNNLDGAGLRGTAAAGEASSAGEDGGADSARLHADVLALAMYLQPSAGELRVRAAVVGRAQVCGLARARMPGHYTRRSHTHTRAPTHTQSQPGDHAAGGAGFSASCGAGLRAPKPAAGTGRGPSCPSPSPPASDACAPPLPPID